MLPGHFLYSFLIVSRKYHKPRQFFNECDRVPDIRLSIIGGDKGYPPFVWTENFVTIFRIIEFKMNIG